MVYKIVLLTLGILAIVEGLFILIFRGEVRRILSKFLKKNLLVRVGIIEIIIGLIILGVSFFF